ncbi:MAG: septal ring lytic transglycosylase RlpA family protein [Zoogloeaceae bacterium]|jgi:rare lipoprotein A|nr:septal ring lytic transglycosylase RlpA family protein [Zoogloeaceae bacterium]
MVVPLVETDPPAAETASTAAAETPADSHPDLAEPAFICTAPPEAVETVVPDAAPEVRTDIPAADIPARQGFTLQGKASYYGKTNKFQGRRTASGERFDSGRLTAASNRFPLGVWLAVRRVDRTGAPTGQCVLVWNNDRMHARHKIRIIDLSLAAARSIGMVRAGVVDVEVRQLHARPERCLDAFALEPDVSAALAGEAGD